MCQCAHTYADAEKALTSVPRSALLPPPFPLLVFPPLLKQSTKNPLLGGFTSWGLMSLLRNWLEKAADQARWIAQVTTHPSSKGFKVRQGTHPVAITTCGGHLSCTCPPMSTTGSDDEVTPKNAECRVEILSGVRGHRS